jgi:hypothetical protein
MANRAVATTTMSTLAGVLRAGVLVATMLLAACATGAATHSASAPGGVTSGDAQPRGSASDASLRPVTPTSATPSPSSRPTGNCATDAQRVTVRAGESPQSVCLRVGAVLRLDAAASPRQPWQAFVTSKEQVLSCGTRQGPDGAASATCQALRPGSAVVQTMTAPFAGDPHGPMQRQWQLAVLVRDG